MDDSFNKRPSKMQLEKAKCQVCRKKEPEVVLCWGPNPLKAGLADLGDPSLPNAFYCADCRNTLAEEV